jgi:cobalt-zinc-cadmium efflux system outer membrane protein
MPQLPEAGRIVPRIPVQPLTLAEALSLAERNNPQLRAAQAGVEATRAGIMTAGAYLNPSLTFGSLGRQVVSISQAAYPGMLHGFNLQQTIEPPRVRETRIRAAQLRQQTAEYSLAEARLAVRGAVKQAFYEALRRRRETELAQGTLNLLEDLRRRIQVQVEVGEAARLELTRAEAEAASARIAVRSAELRYQAALSALYAAVGAPLNGLEPVGEPQSVSLLPPLRDLQQEMLAKHPSLAVAESQIRVAEATAAHERAQRFPSPAVWVDWFRQPEAAQFRYGLSIALPLWNRRQGPIAEAEATRRQTSASYEYQRVQLLAALERAYNMYQVADQQVQISEAGTLRQAEAAVAAAQAAFRLGERGILEVLDAQRVLRAARLDYLNAQFDRQQALIEIEQLRAIDLP